MTAGATTTTAYGARAARRATAHVVTLYLLIYLGYYGVMSTLVVTLTAASFDGGRIAVLVMVFSLTNKIANLPLAPWLDRIPAARSSLLGCVMAGAGFLLLRFSSGMAMTVLSLAVAGVGISINALAVKQLSAAVSDRSVDRSKLFSLISISVNGAAAAASPVALFFVGRHEHGLVLIGVAGLYCAAGLLSFAGRGTVDMGERPPARTSSLRAYLDNLAAPGLRRFLLINWFYWFLYGQLFNVLAVYVSTTLHAAGRLGWLYTLNALLVVSLQLGITPLAARLARGRQIIIVAVSYGVFALAFLAPHLVPGYAGAVVFVALFTLAEMLFVPTGNVMIVGLINPQSRAVGYSLFAISTALGESLGSGAGVAVYRWLTDIGHGNQFWLGAAASAVLFAAVTLALRRSFPLVT